jgi:SAM-dependent methyltransferase
MKKVISFITRNVPRRYLQRVSGLGQRILTVAYAGKKVMCPICEKRFRKFLPYGRLVARENALCPNCLALERHRLIWLYLKEKTGFFRQQQDVLHIAPESCFIDRFETLHRDRYITADMESPWAKVRADIHSMPFGDNAFDVVLCNHVLEHVKDDVRAMREIHRVLKPGGFAILQVPFIEPVPETTYEDDSITDPVEREQVFGQDDHVRRYGRDYAKRIESSGLKPMEEQFARELMPETVDRFKLPKDEIIYKAVKPA